MQRHGASPSIDDIAALIEKAKLAYDDCSDASGGYKDLRKEVRKLRDTLRDLKAEFKDPASEVNRDRSQFSSDLTALVSETNSSLDSLLDLIDEYFKRKDVNTENLRLRQADLDQIGNIRLRLINCKIFVDGILENIEKQERRNERRGHSDEELLDDLRRRMDNIAGVLAPSREYEEDMEETWRLFRDKLRDQGVPSEDLDKYGSNLRRHLRKLLEDGRLSSNSDSPQSRQQPLTLNTSQWLDGIYTPPLSIDTLHFASTDTSIKELGSREENIKFPQAMKSQRAMPGGGRNETDNFRVGSWNSNGTDGGYGNVMAMVRVPEPEITTTDMILRDDYASDRRDPARLLGAPPMAQHGRPRRASDETYLSGSPSFASPIGSARSSTSFQESYRPRLAGSALRPDSQAGSAYGSSPRASGEKLYGSSPIPNISGGMYGHSPRASLSGLVGEKSSFSNGCDNGSDISKASTLQPDQAGRPIPANAQWTKVNRKLISPEVLNGGGYRYEARENYVAILGVLTRDALQILADRTLQVRAARSRRNRESRPVERERPTSRCSNDATPTPGTFTHPPSGPSAFGGIPAQTQQTTPTPTAKQPLKPILKNANKSVRFDNDDLKGSDPNTSETSTPSYTTDSDTESSSDRRRVDPRDSRRPRSNRERDRDSRRERDRDREERHRDDRHRSKPMPIPPKDQYMTIPSSGRRSSWENDSGRNDGSRPSSYNDRNTTPRDADAGRGDRRGDRNGNWSQKLTAGGIGAAAGTILSVATDILMEGLI